MTAILLLVGSYLLVGLLLTIVAIFTDHVFDFIRPIWVERAAILLIFPWGLLVGFVCDGSFRPIYEEMLDILRV